MEEQKITKSEIIDSVYKATDIEKQVIQKVVDSFLKNLRESIAKGNTIEFRGFGTFEPRLRKGRSAARNPRTGEILSSEAHYVAVFRAGKLLKEKLMNLKKDDK